MLFYLSMAFKKLLNFCVVLLYGTEILSKNWDIWNTKFQQNTIFTISFLLCSIFGIHLSKLVQKLLNFLWCFIGRVRDFTNNLWKILKFILKKMLICEILFFFSKFYGLVFVLFLYLLFLTFYFQFRLFVLVNKF